VPTKCVFLLAGALLLAAPGLAPAACQGGETGFASTYSLRHVGKATASGERLQHGALTAAHRRLPFGSTVRVTHRRNGRSVTVRINDRGPFVRGRIIDLSPAAARALGFAGVAPVTVGCG
jgi:rare lipoprotein A